MLIHKCPRCGGKKFCVTAHVTQDWVVDECGNFEKCVTDCVEVIHQPDDEDIWTCDNCGYDAAGSEFLVSEFSDAELEKLWKEFGDVPMNPESEEMEAPFLDFPKGTNREEIWHWFDEKYSKGVAALLYPEEE